MPPCTGPAMRPPLPGNSGSRATREMGRDFPKRWCPAPGTGTGMGWYASSSPGAGSGTGVNIRAGVGAGSCPCPSGLRHTGVSSRSGAFRSPHRLWAARAGGCLSPASRFMGYPVPPVPPPVAHPAHHVPREVDPPGRPEGPPGLDGCPARGHPPSG